MSPQKCCMFFAKGRALHGLECDYVMHAVPDYVNLSSAMRRWQGAVRPRDRVCNACGASIHRGGSACTRTRAADQV